MYILAIRVGADHRGWLFRTRKAALAKADVIPCDAWRLWDCAPNGGWCDSSGEGTGIVNVPWTVGTEYMWD